MKLNFKFTIVTLFAAVGLCSMSCSGKKNEKTADNADSVVGIDSAAIADTVSAGDSVKSVKFIAPKIKTDKDVQMDSLQSKGNKKKVKFTAPKIKKDGEL